MADKIRELVAWQLYQMEVENPGIGSRFSPEGDLQEFYDNNITNDDDHRRSEFHTEQSSLNSSGTSSSEQQNPPYLVNGDSSQVPNTTGPGSTEQSEPDIIRIRRKLIRSNLARSRSFEGIRTFQNRQRRLSAEAISGAISPLYCSTEALFSGAQPDGTFSPSLGSPGQGSNDTDNSDR